MTAIPGDNYEFGLCALITFAYQTFFYIIAATFKFDKVTDLAGGSNFLVLSVVTWVLSSSNSAAKTAANILVLLWGLRLSGYLFYRILMINEDNRFDGMREDPLKFLGFWIFQFIWVYVVSLPLIFLNGSDDSSATLSAIAIAGVVLSSIGLLLETVADQTKFSFRQIPENKSKWCAIGVWQYSRHPNYFGEILFWWGVLMICSTQMIDGRSWAYFTLISPVFITLLILFVSGLPILEPSAHKRFKQDPKYLEYLEKTSILIPMPNFVYKYTPSFVKEIFFFEWQMYKTDLVSIGSSGSADPLSPFQTIDSQNLVTG